MTYVSQIIMLYTSDLHSAVSIIFHKLEKKKIDNFFLKFIMYFSVLKCTEVITTTEFIRTLIQQ